MPFSGGGSTKAGLARIRVRNVLKSEASVDSENPVPAENVCARVPTPDDH